MSTFISIKFKTTVPYRGAEKTFLSVNEFPNIKIEITKDLVKVSDGEKEVVVPMSNVSHILYDK
jgi:hypothetical protein